MPCVRRDHPPAAVLFSPLQLPEISIVYLSEGVLTFEHGIETTGISEQDTDQIAQLQAPALKLRLRL